jgi:hypothetical protein
MWWVGGRRAQRLSKSLEDDAKEERRVSVIGRSGAERVTE